MGARVDHRIGFESMRQINMGTAISESELHYPHAGNVQALTESVNFRSDKSQILGDKRQITERLAQHVEEIVFGSIHPTPVDSRGLAGGNLPIFFKTAEMVEPDDVVSLQGRTHSLHPPVVSPRFQNVPAIQRIPPALTGFAERVRRHPGNDGGLKIMVEVENIGMRPHIGAVVIHKDSHIPNDADGAGHAIRTQGTPLLKKSELDDAL